MIQLHEKINANRDKLSKVEYEIGTYLVDNYQTNKSINLKVIAKECNVSTTSVIRFCKKLGFDGYKDLVIFLAINASKDASVAALQNFDVIRGDIIENVRKTLSLIDPHTLSYVVTLLMSARKVHIYGLSSSRFICEDFARKLNLSDISADSIYEEEMIFLSSKRVKDNDVVFIMSLSGENDTLANAIEIAQKKQVKVITLTNNTANKFASLANVALYVDVEKASVQVNRYRPRYIFMIITEIIISEILKLNDQEVSNKKFFKD